MARRRGIGKIKRVQFIGDGASWIQKIWLHAFKNCGAIRTLDFVHAASYLHKLIETLCESGEIARNYKRFKGILKKWGGASLIKNLKLTFGKRLEKRSRRIRVFTGTCLDDGLSFVAQTMVLYRLRND